MEQLKSIKEHLARLTSQADNSTIVVERPSTNIFEDLRPELVLQLAADEVINEKDLFDDCIVLYLSQISKMKLLWASIPLMDDTQRSQQAKQVKFAEVELPEKFPFGTISPGANMNLTQQQVRMHIDSPFVYNKVLDLDAKSGSISVIDENKISGKVFNHDEFEMRIVYAPSSDGKVKIPITLILRKELLNRNGEPRFPDTPSKLLINSYGCYGLPLVSKQIEEFI